MFVLAHQRKKTWKISHQPRYWLLLPHNISYVSTITQFILSIYYNKFMQQQQENITHDT